MEVEILPEAASEKAKGVSSSFWVKEIRRAFDHYLWNLNAKPHNHTPAETAYHLCRRSRYEHRKEEAAP